MIKKLSDVILSSNTGLDAIKRAPIVEHDTGVRCLRIQDISQSKVFDDWGFCDVEKRNYSKFKLMQGDIVIARTGATVGVNMLVRSDLDAVYNNGLIRIKIDTTKTIPEYIYYNLQSHEYKGHINAISGGTATQPNMKMKALLEYEINLPDLKTQRTIADTLSALDARITENKKINHHLEQMAQAVFKSWFVDFEPWGGVMPSDWREGALSEIANIIMGQSPSGTSYNEDSNGTVFYQGRAEFGSRFPTRRLFTTEPKRMAAKGDILMSVRAPVGDLNIAFETCCLGRGLAGIQSNNNCQSFILYTMFALKQQLNMFNGEGTVFGSINKTDMANLPVIIPTNEVIRQFEEMVSPMDAAIEANHAEICNLQTERDFLLPRLISGELSVANLTDK